MHRVDVTPELLDAYRTRVRRIDIVVPDEPGHWTVSLGPGNRIRRVFVHRGDRGFEADFWFDGHTVNIRDPLLPNDLVTFEEV